MAWARVDDGWWCHPKTMALDLAARGLWVSALSWSCAQRSRVIPPQLPMWLGADEATTKQIEASGLWHGPGHDCDDCDPVEAGWVVHHWSEYQERSLSEKRAEAGRKGGKKSRPPKQNGSKPEAKAEAGALPGPSQPSPKEQTPKGARARQLPDGWTPDPATTSQLAERFPHLDLDRELEKFCGHARANGRTLKDWNAGWRNWVIRADEWSPKTGPRQVSTFKATEEF